MTHRKLHDSEISYQNNRQIALDNLETIRRLICEKMDACESRTPQSWGHAGSMNHINKELENIISFIS